MRDLIRLPRDVKSDRKLLERLRYNLGNTGWSGGVELLEKLFERNCDRAVLECGSGLTTMHDASAKRCVDD